MNTSLYVWCMLYGLVIIFLCTWFLFEVYVILMRFFQPQKKKKKKKIKCGVSLNSLATLHLVNKSYMFTMNASNSFFSVAICLVPLLLIVLIQLFISIFDNWNFYPRCWSSIKPSNRGHFYARYEILISNSWSLNTLTIG